MQFENFIRACLSFPSDDTIINIDNKRSQAENQNCLEAVGPISDQPTCVTHAIINFDPENDFKNKAQLDSEWEFSLGSEPNQFDLGNCFHAQDHSIPSLEPFPPSLPTLPRRRRGRPRKTEIQGRKKKELECHFVDEECVEAVTATCTPPIVLNLRRAWEPEGIMMQANQALLVGKIAGIIFRGSNEEVLKGLAAQIADQF